VTKEKHQRRGGSTVPPVTVTNEKIWRSWVGGGEKMLCGELRNGGDSAAGVFREEKLAFG